MSASSAAEMDWDSESFVREMVRPVGRAKAEAAGPRSGQFAA